MTNKYDNRKYAYIALNYYRLLDVPPDAGYQEIRESYLRLARKWGNGAEAGEEAEEIMKIIDEAYSVLSDENKRRDFDSIWEIESASFRETTKN